MISSKIMSQGREHRTRKKCLLPFFIIYFTEKEKYEDYIMDKNRQFHQDTLLSVINRTPVLLITIPKVRNCPRGL